jgi:uncharacterized membrane protein (DUF485 family)
MKTKDFVWKVEFSFLTLAVTLCGLAGLLTPYMMHAAGAGPEQMKRGWLLAVAMSCAITLLNYMRRSNNLNSVIAFPLCCGAAVIGYFAVR